MFSYSALIVAIKLPSSGGSDSPRSMLIAILSPAAWVLARYISSDDRDVMYRWAIVRHFGTGQLNFGRWHDSGTASLHSRHRDIFAQGFVDIGVFGTGIAYSDRVSVFHCCPPGLHQRTAVRSAIQSSATRGASWTRGRRRASGAVRRECDTGSDTDQRVPPSPLHLPPSPPSAPMFPVSASLDAHIHLHYSSRFVCLNGHHFKPPYSHNQLEQPRHVVSQ